MSLSASLNSALSGLTAMSRATQTVSSNIANAQTEGYAARQLSLTSAAIGTGVRIVGEDRIVDQILLRDRRLADAGAASASTTVDYLEKALDLVGLPGDAGNLGSLVTNFGSALITATARPEDSASLQSILDAAKALVQGLGVASAGIQDLRQDADAAIAAEIETLNTSLSNVADLNADILRFGSDSDAANGLIDQRQRMVDAIATQVSLRVIEDENGALRLYSDTGLALLESRPANFNFETTPIITADMTLASGALSAVSRNGHDVSVTSASGSLSGGTIAALFSARDDALVQAQSDLDQLAADLVRRFENPAVDPTLSIGEAGLFTDRGLPLDPLNTVGLAARLSVSDRVDPAQGGELWRLRAGLNATDPNPVGDITLLNALQAALSETSVGRPAFSNLANDTASAFSQRLSTAEGASVTAATRLTAISQTEVALGVDTDQELQRLLVIEQAYTANAKVIQTAEELIRYLLEI